MQIKEMQEYAQIRVKARAYLCYIMGRNISNIIKDGDIERVLVSNTMVVTSAFPIYDENDTLLSW